MNYYIASCVFTTRFSELSNRIQAYITEKQKMEIVWCCTPKYKLQIFEEELPEKYRSTWASHKDTADWQTGDSAYSVCHNCNNIIEEVHKGVHAYSLWELILSDEDFKYPDYQGRTMTIQDCWRSRDRLSEQFTTEEVVCYCHYCLEGLKLGGVKGMHIAELLFPPK